MKIKWTVELFVKPAPNTAVPGHYSTSHYTLFSLVLRALNDPGLSFQPFCCRFVCALPQFTLATHKTIPNQSINQIFSTQRELSWVVLIVKLMESLLKDFELENKDSSIEALSKWRSAVATWLVKNPRRRFRNVADLVKRVQAQEKRQKIQVLISSFIHSFIQFQTYFLSLFFLLWFCLSLFGKNDMEPNTVGE